MIECTLKLTYNNSEERWTSY